MIIFFFGNCQAQAVMTALKARNERLNIAFAPNSPFLPGYDPKLSDQKMTEADVIISQPVLNMENPLYHEAMRARCGSKLVMMPYM